MMFALFGAKVYSIINKYAFAIFEHNSIRSAMTETNLFQRPDNSVIPQYYLEYVKLAGGDNLFDALRASRELTLQTIDLIPHDKEDFSYAKDKWSLKTVLSHIIDSERVFAYRALRFSRMDKTELQGFDENEYASNCNAGSRRLWDIRDEYVSVRDSTIQLYKQMDRSMLNFAGVANELKVSPLILGWIIAGHNIHHCYVIKRRYLGEHHE